MWRASHASSCVILKANINQFCIVYWPRAVCSIWCICACKRFSSQTSDNCDLGVPLYGIIKLYLHSHTCFVRSHSGASLNCFVFQGNFISSTANFLQLLFFRHAFENTFFFQMYFFLMIINSAAGMLVYWQCGVC